MASKKRVLVTGACGVVASQILPWFRENYELSLVDVRAVNARGEHVPGVVVADLGDPDRRQYQQLFVGHDTVVHLGYRHPGTQPWGVDVAPIDRFDAEYSNIQLAQNVYRCAFDTGVQRVVMASSNHATDWYEHALVHALKQDMVYPSDLPLSDNFYGWSKASYELLGFVYACGGLGRQLEVVQIRIGAPRELSARNYEGPPAEQHVRPDGSSLANFKRDLGAYISPRDLAQLFSRAIDTLDIRDEHGVPWLVVYGISGNTRTFWSLQSARCRLGYQPQDDSEVKYSNDIYRLLTGPGAGAPGGRLGG